MQKSIFNSRPSYPAGEKIWLLVKAHAASRDNPSTSPTALSGASCSGRSGCSSIQAAGIPPRRPAGYVRLHHDLLLHASGAAGLVEEPRGQHDACTVSYNRH